MIEINDKTKCNGCYGCQSICPKKCIDMQVDSEGFYYPKVRKDLCIECNLCEKVCPVLNNINNKNYKNDIKVYACKNSNDIDRINASSGGIFSILCNYVINKNGVVFGAAFDKQFNVKHMYAETIAECKKFEGSKYVQSNINSSYLEAKRFLESGRLVLFSGTQCQIKGLNLYLMKQYTNLITVDIICHGVPSPKILQIYRENLNKKYDNNIKEIKFRDKRLGWRNFSFTAKFENNKVYSSIASSDIYMKGFLGNLYLRPSCYECKAKNFTSNSDISLADYWGIEGIHPDFSDDNGISLVILNSVNGQKIFNNISNYIEKIESDLDYAIKNNPCIVRPVEYNKNRKKFFSKVNNKNFEKLTQKYTIGSIKGQIKLLIKKFIELK